MPLPYPLKFSYCWAISLCALHLIAFLVICWTHIDVALKLLLSFSVVMSLCVSLALKILSFRGTQISFSLTDAGITFFAGQEIKWQGVVLPQTLVTPYFVLLRAQSHLAKTQYIELIFFDAMHSEDFRQLRTQLKLAV